MSRTFRFLYGDFTELSACVARGLGTNRWSLEGETSSKCEKMVEIECQGSMKSGSEFAFAKLWGVESSD